MTRSNLRIHCTLAVTTLLASASPVIAQAPVAPSLVPHWEQLGPMPGAGPEVLRLAASADPDLIYASSRAGVLASFDRGVTWELRSRHSAAYGGFAFLSASPTDPDTLIKSEITQSLRRSTDGGLTWLEPTVPPDGTFHRSPRFASATTVFVSTFYGIWRSLDGADHFEEVLADFDLMGGYCLFVGVDRNDSQHVYAAVSGVGLSETVDGGVNWAFMAPQFEWSDTVTVPAFDRSLVMTNDMVAREAHVARHPRAAAAAVGRGLETPILDFANAPAKLFAGTTGQGVVVLRY